VSYQLLFPIGTIVSFIDSTLQKQTSDAEIELIFAITLDGMGLLYNPLPLHNQLPPELVQKLRSVAAHPEIESYAYRLGLIVSSRKPEARWQIWFDRGLCSLKFETLG